jgi:hypothetical protein
MNGKDALLFIRWVLCLPFRIFNSCVRLRRHRLVPAPGHRNPNILRMRHPHIPGGTVAVLLFLHLPRASPADMSPLRAHT